MQSILKAVLQNSKCKLSITDIAGLCKAINKLTFSHKKKDKL